MPSDPLCIQNFSAMYDILTDFISLELLYLIFLLYRWIKYRKIAFNLILCRKAVSSGEDIFRATSCILHNHQITAIEGTENALGAISKFGVHFLHII